MRFFKVIAAFKNWMFHRARGPAVIEKHYRNLSNLAKELESAVTDTADQIMGHHDEISKAHEAFQNTKSEKEKIIEKKDAARRRGSLLANKIYEVIQ